MAEQDFLTRPTEEPSKKEETPYEAISNSVTGLGSRLRVLEERYTNVRKKTQLTDQNVLEFERDVKTEIKSLNQDLLEVKRSLSEINENLISISSELKKCVKQSELKVLEKYIDMWQPLNFITKDELNKLLE